VASRAGRAGARRSCRGQKELLGLAERVLRWNQSLADALEGGSPVPEPLQPDRQTTGRLIDAVRRDLYDEDGQATGTSVRIIWTGDHLEAVRRLQPALAVAAGRGGRRGAGSEAIGSEPIRSEP